MPSRSGFTYQLESRPDFNTDWSDEGAAQPGTGADLTLTPTISATGTKFFRIRVQ